MEVALARLLQRSPNIRLIPGTSSVKHLQENLNAATLHIPSEMLADLDSIGGGAAQRF
jgi:aryl-alcohol dehydrogenase-like predicted oxidoreductase